MSRAERRHTYYSLKSFFSFLHGSVFRLIFTALCFAVAMVPLGVVPIYVGRLVADLSANTANNHQIIVNAWLLVILSVVHQLLWVMSEFVYLKLVQPMSFNYENTLFHKVISKPYPYFVDKFTGKLSSNITTIRQELYTFVESICYNYTSQIVGLTIMAIILSSINWQTGVLFLGGLIIMLIAGMYTIGYSTLYEKKMTDIQSTKNGKIIDAITNFVNVKSFRKETSEIRSIRAEQVKTVTAARRSGKWTVIFWSIMGTIVRMLIWPATIGINVYLFIHHEESIGQLATMLTAILMFTSTIWESIWQLSQFSLRLARMEEAYIYLFGKTNIMREADGPTTLATPAFTESLELRDLHFAYPDKPEAEILKSISLRIQKGEKIGVVGHSGGGKTTISKLLLGYYPVKPGEVLIDGQPLETRVVAELMSYVPQDTSLFHRSIADNIAYATNREVKRSEIIQAAKQAHADEFIGQIDQGYEALVGERGVKLSAGQRQRIAIARAILDNKPILVLDEATSALDSESELLVQAGLEALWKNKTVIAIAHRLSTLRHMDRIIVISSGQIIEEGTHQSLLDAKGAYAKLWAHQSGGFLEDD